MYTVYNNGQHYAFIDGFTRRYYKTINVPVERGTFVQPILSANGTLGGNSFAVQANQEANASPGSPYAYYAFDDNTSTYWRSGTTTGWLVFYSPTPIAVKTLTWTCFYMYPTSGTVEASNDNSSWTELCKWTNSNSTSFNIVVNSNVDYKYYRINITGISKDVIHCQELDITATYVVKDAYSYETEGTADDYDRYEDVPNMKGVEIK